MFDFYVMHGRGGSGGNDMSEGPVANSEDAEGESRRCGSIRSATAFGNTVFNKIPASHCQATSGEMQSG